MTVRGMVERRRAERMLREGVPEKTVRMMTGLSGDEIREIGEMIRPRAVEREEPSPDERERRLWDDVPLF